MCTLQYTRTNIIFTELTCEECIPHISTLRRVEDEDKAMKSKLTLLLLHQNFEVPQRRWWAK